MSLSLPSTRSIIAGAVTGALTNVAFEKILSPFINRQAMNANLSAENLETLRWFDPAGTTYIEVATRGALLGAGATVVGGVIGTMNVSPGNMLNI